MIKIDPGTEGFDDFIPTQSSISEASSAAAQDMFSCAYCSKLFAIESVCDIHLRTYG